MTPVLEIALFRRGPAGYVLDDERKRSQKALLWFLEALCRTNQDIIRMQKARGNPIPELYSSGIKYLRENGTENWQDIYRNLELMTGDCEDLACHRVAELRENYKRRAQPFVTFRRSPDGKYHYHCVLIVEGPDGWRLEDPSRKLGMGFEDFYETMGRGDRDKLIFMFDMIQKGVSGKKLALLKEVG